MRRHTGRSKSLRCRIAITRRESVIDELILLTSVAGVNDRQISSSGLQQPKDLTSPRNTPLAGPKPSG
jgi:hypothetical protein